MKAAIGGPDNAPAVLASASHATAFVSPRRSRGSASPMSGKSIPERNAVGNVRTDANQSTRDHCPTWVPPVRI